MGGAAKSCKRLLAEVIQNNQWTNPCTEPPVHERKSTLHVAVGFTSHMLPNRIQYFVEISKNCLTRSSLDVL